jgi:antitoxin CptB
MRLEDPDARLKRMAMRSWRRGTKEMDLILGPYADAHLKGMTPDRLELFDSLLAENDHDLYAWVTGALPVPERFSALLSAVSAYSLTKPRGF